MSDANESAGGGGDFPHASLIEGIRFTAQIGVPNVVQGLFNKRGLATRIAGTVGADQHAYGLMEGLVRKYGPGPFYVRVAADETLLVSDPDDIRFVLDGSPDPFASEPGAKSKGMKAFQPDALTISHGKLWDDRRAFAESALDTGEPVHRAAAQYVEVAAEEAAELPRPLRWDSFNDGFRRLTRRVVFGEAAAGDTALSKLLEDLMSEGNRMPGKPAARYEEFEAKIRSYLDDAAPGSLAEFAAEAPSTAKTNTAGQVIHWLFAMGDTLAANVFRSIAVLATHPEQLREVHAELSAADLTDPKSIASLEYTAGCLYEAMRLWPTTPMFGRIALRDVTFPGGAVLPAGTEVLIHNLFDHRNRDRIPYADAFAPEEWVSGDAAADWSYNFFSHGPQVCPGADLAILLGQTVLAQLLHDTVPTLSGASLRPKKPLPYNLDVGALKIELKPRKDG